MREFTYLIFQSLIWSQPIDTAWYKNKYSLGLHKKVNSMRTLLKTIFGSILVNPKTI